MSYHQAAQDVPQEEMPWVPDMAALSSDEHAEAPQRMSSASFINLARSQTTPDSVTHTWQHQSTIDTIQEGSAFKSSSPEYGSSSRQSTARENPLGLSHQSSQFGIHRVPIPEGTPVVASPEPSNTEPKSGMPSPDETLIGGSSPRRVSRWGRLWNFGAKNLHLKRSSSNTLLLNMEPIAGVKCPSGVEETACDGTPPAPYHKHCYNNNPEPCSSIKDIQAPKKLFTLNLLFSLYSTAGSLLWLTIAFYQPRWNRRISSSSGIGPSTATVIAAAVSKSIEMSFVTTFIMFLGQSITRRAISRGTNLAELSVRNWVIQPGSVVTQSGLFKNAGLTTLGMLSLLAALVTAFYTTASEAMVSPKLMYGGWERKPIEGYVRSSYGNADFVKMSCPTMLTELDGSLNSSISCTDVRISGESYRNLQAFMGVWTTINFNGSNLVRNLKERPAGTASLNGNITLYGSWIETEHSNVTAHFEDTGRIINNVTLAMPHPGVAAAAAVPLNGILQPWDLSGVGEYVVKAGVVSPAVNVMCVNMAQEELNPLVYAEWPNAKINETEFAPKIGWEHWLEDIPWFSNETKYGPWNKTAVDDIFRWGTKYGRRPPVFRLIPVMYNTVVNPPVQYMDAVYILGRSPHMHNYTLCELRSWVSPKCSTQFNISGLTGSKMWAHCEDPEDANSYYRSSQSDQGWSLPSTNWTDLATQWRSASDLNGGERKSDPANSRILTQLALRTPYLPTNLPSMAEAIAVFASSTLILASVDTPFRHYWGYEKPVLGDPGVLHRFNAEIKTQEYTSRHVYKWQRVFYCILIFMVALNVLCFVYIFTHCRKVTDYTEAQNLFSLALNSAPNEQLRGTCGGGPEKEHMGVPLRVGYDSDAKHYFLEQVGQGPLKRARDGQNYARLRNSRSWI